jgi:hypothetical protein
MPGTPSFIIVATASGPEQLQAWLNTISGQPVLTEAVTLTDSSGNEKIGQQPSAASVPVVLPSDQQALPINLQQIGEMILRLGQNTKDQSVPVTVASDQGMIAVTVTDGLDTIGTAARPVRVDPTGTTTQPVSSLTNDGAGSPIGSETFFNLPIPGVNQIYLHVISPSSIGPGTAIPIQVDVVAGKSNDSTPQYQPIPEGPAGRSVIVEGTASGVALPVSGTIAVSSVNNTVTAPLNARLSDGVVGYDLAPLNNLLRAIVKQNYDARQVAAIQAGQFIPMPETLEFLGA